MNQSELQLEIELTRIRIDNREQAQARDAKALAELLQQQQEVNQ